MKKMLPVSLAVLSLSMLPAPMILAEGPSPNQFYFLPEMDGIAQGYVGDCMPYYLSLIHI